MKTTLTLEVDALLLTQLQRVADVQQRSLEAVINAALTAYASQYKADDLFRAEIQHLIATHRPLLEALSKR